MSELTPWTRETPAPGVVIYQPRSSFRYSADVFWLVGFALEGPVCTSALELGTGSAVGAMLLETRGIPTVGIDLRPEWRPFWERTLAESASQPRLQVADVTTYQGPRADLIVCNPPYFLANSGPHSPDPLKAAARTESTATLQQFVRAAARHLTPNGRACFVVPRDREDELAGELHVRRVTRVGARRSLVELSQVAGPVKHVAYSDRGKDAERLYQIALIGPTSDR